MRKALTAVLFLGLLVSHAASQVPDDKLIAPGIGIGHWTLQMTLAELATMNGVPGSSGRDGSLDTNRPESSWVRWHDVHALVARVRPDAQVDVLEIRSEDYKTAKGIGAGVPRDVVELVYGKPTAVTLLSIPPHILRLVQHRAVDLRPDGTILRDRTDNERDDPFLFSGSVPPRRR